MIYLAEEKIESKIKKKEKYLKQILDLEDINYKEWYLNVISDYVENNLDKVFEIIAK